MMNADLLEDILLSPCGSLTAGGVVYVAGHCATDGKHSLRRLGAALAGAALIMVMLFGIDRRMELIALAVGAAGFGLFVLGSSWIVLSILGFLLEPIVAAMAAPVIVPMPKLSHRPPEPEPEPEPLPPPPPPPPPPTREELVAAAKKRYERDLELAESLGLDEAELTARKEHLRQKYLREIDQV